jgi:CspA family cold shock protein
VSNAATVRIWHSDEGWGVLDSAETPGGCWAHFSHAAVSGYAGFEAGQAVWLEWEATAQDGYAYRALRFWPAGSEPVDRPRATEPSAAYHSTLTLTFDDQPPG